MKQVVSTFSQGIRQVDDTRPQRIYVFNHKKLNAIYKMQGMLGQYAFVNLDNSASVWEVNEDFKKLISSVSERFDVYEFDSLKEFAEWLVKECK